MKIYYSDDPRRIGYDAVNDSVTISADDRVYFRNIAKLMNQAPQSKDRDDVERIFYKKMLEKYGKTVAGELLSMLWAATKERDNE